MSDPHGGRGREPVRIAVVGAGSWGCNLIRNLADLPDAEVRWVCDVDPVALTRIRRPAHAADLTMNVVDVLEDATVEAVVIATPIATHFELARLALDAGKHVFVEKPMASSTDEAVELVELATRKGLVLMPGHTFLYSPSVTMIDELIKGGDLGEIHFVSTSRLNLGIHQPGVSVVWDLAPHDVSMLRLWLGELPTSVTAISRGCVMPDMPDVAFVHLVFPSGTIANVELGWLAPTKLRRTVIVGSKKMIVYDDTSSEPVRIYDSRVVQLAPQTFGEFQLSYRTGEIVSPPPRAVEPLYLELEDFCSSVRTGRPPRATAESGLEVVRVVEAVDRSLALNERVDVVTDQGVLG